MKCIYLIWSIMAAATLGGCSTPRYVDLGPGGRQDFDSSVVSLQRQDRLPFLQLLEFQTTSHTATSMSKEGGLLSAGLTSPYQSKYTFGWEGRISIASPGPPITIAYTATLGDEIIGDYLLKPMGWLSTQPRNQESEKLLIAGWIVCHGDSARFGHGIGESGLSTLMDGYLIFRQDTLYFRTIYKEVLHRQTLKRVSYGYGIYWNDRLQGAIDFERKPNLVYLRKDMDPSYRSMLAGYLVMAAGNGTIVPRRSTVLKRFF